MAKLLLLVASALVINGAFAGRIIGGNPADQGQFPSIAYLMKQEISGGRTFFCAGSLIDDNWVLTAAHCLKGHTVGNTRIRTGELDSFVVTPYEQMVSVSRFIPHPLYSETQNLNDIALIELATPIQSIDDVVKPIVLPFNVTEYYPGEDCAVAGWGSIAEGGATQHQLRFTYIPLVSQNDCEVAYPGLISSSMICAGYPQGGTDACAGDSGGPLSCGDVQNQLDGIVSWGIGCGRPGYPGVYTKVAPFVDWIVSNVGLENLQKP